jgi:hypothetical protein
MEAKQCTAAGVRQELALSDKRSSVRHWQLQESLALEDWQQQFTSRQGNHH